MSALDFRALLQQEKEKAFARLRGSSAGENAGSRHGKTETKTRGEGAKGQSKSEQKPKSSAFDEDFAPFRRDAESLKVLGEEHRVDQGELPSVYYIREFINEEEEKRLLSSAESATHAWVRLRVRRLQLWGRNPNDGSVAALAASGVPRPSFPPFISQVSNLLSMAKVFPGGEGDGEGRTNSCLLNSYSPGQGILPHTDGPSYESKTATLSLGSPAVMTFSAESSSFGGPRRPLLSLLLEVSHLATSLPSRARENAGGYLDHLQSCCASCDIDTVWGKVYWKT